MDLFVTVGTSLLDKWYEDQKIPAETTFRAFRKRIEIDEDNFSAYENALSDNVCDCAEYHSIKEVIRLFPKDQFHVFLLYTGKIGYKIASLLESAITEHLGEDIPVEPIATGFEIENPKETSIVFLKVLKNMIEKRRQVSCAMIVTGGYKLLSDYCYLLASIFRIPVFYKQEKMEKIMKFHPLPVNWDFQKFFTEITRIRSGNEESFNLLSALGETEEDLAYTFLYEEQLIRKIEDPTLRTLLHESIPIWSHLWIGDQIPETVEHSKKHSERILDRFRYLLEQDEQEFWKQLQISSDSEKGEYVFLIIASAYLHDIGHTILTLPSIQDNAEPLLASDFPDIVRRFHHVFTVCLLCRDRGPLGLKDLSEDLWNALCLICLYHRKEMTLAEATKSSETDKNPQLNKSEEREKDNKKQKELQLLTELLWKCYGVEYTPLITNDKYAELDPKRQKLSIQVAAMLKILDEMDVQTDRVVDEYYRKERERRTKEEIEFYKGKCISPCETLSVKEKTELFENLIYGKEIPEEILLKSKIAFKIAQEEHFNKHAGVKAVLPYLNSKERPIVKLNVKGSQCEDFENNYSEQVHLLEADIEASQKAGKPFPLLPFDLDPVFHYVDEAE